MTLDIALPILVHLDGSIRHRVTHRERRCSPRDVHEFQLDAVRVRKEDGVVAGHVLGVLARRVEDRSAPSPDVARERVHLRAALRPEGHLAEPDAILGEGLARVAGVRLLEPEAAAGAEKPDHAAGVPHAGVAETGHERGVEGPRARPELRGRAVIVGGTSSRGVVTAASYEARRFGVRSAMPTVQARALCPDAVFLQGDMAKYQRVSAEIRRLFTTISPDVEPLSLDEAFIDITASQRLLGPPLAIGRLLKDRVRAATALAVSVGVGPGKMVAKIASDLAKPDGLLEVPADRVAAFLHPLPAWRLWGVGPVTEAALARAGITTIGQLAARPAAELAPFVGGAAADHLVRLACGQDARVVEPDLAAKSYGEEGTVAADARDDRRA